MDEFCSRYDCYRSVYNRYPDNEPRWTEVRNVRTNTFDEQVYLEKDFTINDGISLYPGMTLSLLSFVMELKRNGPMPTFPSILEFNVFLDGGSVLLVELAQIAEKYALEFE